MAGGNQGERTITEASNQSITLADLARLSRVSRRVVDEIMSGRPGNGRVRFSETTRQRVLALARQHNYRPNRAARSLRGRRHNCLGIYVASSIGHIQWRTLHGILAECQRTRQFPVFEIAGQEPGGMPISLEECSVDGIIVFELNGPLEAQLSRCSEPVLYVNTNIRQVPGSITYDERGGVRLGLEHFRLRGKRQPAFMYSGGTHYSTSERLAGFRQATGQWGLGAPCLELDGSRDVVGQMREFLAIHRDVDSVLLCSDLLAPDLYDAAASLGKRIPADLAVIGFDNREHVDLIRPRLTALSVDLFELGCQSVKLINRLIAGERVIGPEIFKFSLYPRQST